MKAVGIVAEYNPFHNGHLHHVTETKKITGLPVIAIMSGSLCQRGEPAFLNKWHRSRLAVENGVDLVLELPTVFTTRSAEYFAKGAIDILAAIGCVSTLSCGAENPSFDFATLARIMTGSKFQQALQTELKCGKSYAAACAQLLQAHTGSTAQLNTPNDILALEYSKALLKHDIKPIFMQRTDNGYNSPEIEGSIASATAIRTDYTSHGLLWQQAVPPSVKSFIIQNSAGYDEALLWQLISYRLRLLSPQAIAELSQCSEGMENLLKQTAGCSTLSEALTAASQKRYPTSRLRRTLLQLLLDRPRSYYEQSTPAYIRVLAFNDTGRQLLKEMKKSAQLPIITKLGKNPTYGQSTGFAQQMELDIAAAELLSFLQSSSVGIDYTTSPAYIK